MNPAAVVAAEYERRLSGLLAERLGGAEGGLMRHVDRAAPYLPNELAMRVRQLVADLAALSSGRAEMDNIDKFRASADAIIAAVAMVLPRGTRDGRAASPRRTVFWHLLVALAAPFVGLSLNYTLKIHTPLLAGVSLLWAWGGYVYWVIDRIVKLWLPPSVTRGGLRTFVAVLFFWCPVALGWALLNVKDWQRAKYAIRHAIPHDASITFNDRDQFAVNPTTGLPMMGSVDIGGNPYGFFGKLDD